MKINEIITQVLLENNKHWLRPELALWNIEEGRVPITRKDVHDIIKLLPIKIYGNNIEVEITDEGIVIKEKDFKLITKHIGVITLNYDDFLAWRNQRNPEGERIGGKTQFDVGQTRFYCISRSESLRGLQLDEIIETERAKSNPKYDEIMGHTKYCLI